MANKKSYGFKTKIIKAQLFFYFFKIIIAKEFMIYDM